MSSRIFNLVNGEKYGDVNDPKTRWSNHGVLMVNEEKADAADVEAFERLIEARAISMKLESLPLSQHWNGFLSIFKRTSRDEQGAAKGSEQHSTDDGSDKPIDLSEIPF